MRSRTVASLLVGVALIVGCGEATDTAWKLGDDLAAQKVAFVAPGSDSVLQMHADGSNVQPFTGPMNPPKVWPDQLRSLNTVCGGYPGTVEEAMAAVEDPIELVSPDGASRGPLDDNWSPTWSPDGDYVAVACGRDDDHKVVVVSDVEQPGSRTGWSRARRGTLSDRMEIYLVAIDGSAVTQLTSNEAGDWLPRWHPSGNHLLIESNRDGNSEIYQLSTTSTTALRITNREADDQAPVWSNGYPITGAMLAFASNANGKFEVHTDSTSDSGEPFATGQLGRPIPWPN